MFTVSQIVTFWGSSSFHKIRRSSLRNARLPPGTKTFLVETGLPTKLKTSEEALGISLEVDDGDRLPTLAEYLDSEGMEEPIGLNTNRYWRIGSSFEAELCLDEGNKGAVVRIHLDTDLPRVDCINGSVEQFLAFLWIYEKYAGKGFSLARDELEAVIKRQEEEFTEVDSSAINDPEKWWSVILQEIKHGLL
jgi:SUKH-4 immunity protein